MAKLKKNLKLFDVYAISTGAMFSSGLFLLPGIAAAQTGSSIVLAYLLAGVLILPAMLSIAELSTAMPRSGGSYFIVDRAMGPLIGMIGGLGTWIALVLKSAFALIGMGAYLGIFFDVPIVPLAVALTVGFGVLNLVGAKESSGLQNFLVSVLLILLGVFVAQGLATLFFDPTATASAAGAADAGGESREFLTDGIGGLMATVGMVFVSYAGLTKVTSVAEEVENPDRNIPLAMILSLATATTLYCVGVYVMNAVLDPEVFYTDLTPVATAAEAFNSWLPGDIGVMMMVVAAIAAFASTGNAGVMSASRYPFAMARDKLMPPAFGEISAKGIPVWAVIGTVVTMIVCLVTLDIAAVAKLASAFQLILFALICVAVIVMRESKLEFYRPGFRSPLYPWVQIAGVLISGWLIWKMGWLAVGFSLALVVLAVVAYKLYAADKVSRRGAIRHVWARLGRTRHHELGHELRRVASYEGLRDEDAFKRLFDEAIELDLAGPMSFEEMLVHASDLLANDVDVDTWDLMECFLEQNRIGMMPIEDQGAVPHHLYHGLDAHKMLIVRVDGGVSLELDEATTHVAYAGRISTFVFVLSPDDNPAQHYRFVSEIANRLHGQEPFDPKRPPVYISSDNSPPRSTARL
ncbi:APC family permease [Persicimonas caeni]|uniref:APC family permease n=1 Tax=Persicimonas caeni TaxID=2292766 RepID=A0A4Y6PLZ0_PERCE|nr:APC family permease [Persicimonas caeni]QDG49344.1 APC family permease [Persicimonas caeni]QED30565.1 APC family permease [Persicimonas caeni]